MGFQEKLQHDGSLESDSKKWVIAGIPLCAPLKQIYTKKEAGSQDDDDDDEYQEDCSSSTTATSTTPRGQDSIIPAALTCPPAPKKRKASLKYRYAVREFFKPPELESLFIRHVERAN